jgi:septum formation protein
MPASVILASGSHSRAKLLTNAGVVFTAIPADVDETAVKDEMWAMDATALDCAAALAALKAVSVSRRHPEALVIGADQMLDCDGTWFDKPKDMAAAAEQLLKLAGKTHVLPTATAVFRNGVPVWEHAATPRLTMRDFDAAFVARYLEHAGAGVVQSVGAYHLEGVGVQLFQAVEGDFFTILGLPLLPLLTFLRAQGVDGPANQTPRD